MNKRHEKPVIAVNTLSVRDARLGGGFTYLHHLLPRMIQAAPHVEFHLLVTRGNRQCFSCADASVSFTTMPDLCMRGAVRTAIDRWWISSWLRKIEADLYFVPYGWLPRQAPCPTVWTFQNLFLLPGHRQILPHPRNFLHGLREQTRWRLIDKFLLADTIKADRVIAVSESAKRDFIANFPDSDIRVRVVCEGVDERFTPEAPEAGDREVLRRYELDRPYYLSVSTLMRHKRFYSLIRTFVGFKEQTGAPGVLAIAGDDWGGYRRDLEHAVAKLGAWESVRFLGHVAPSDLPALYRRAIAFILLSAKEAFGLPALEAMACGCPTVTADIGGLSEVVADGGIQIAPDDPDRLVQVLTELSRSPELREKLARAGRRRADNFTWSESARNTLAVFADALGRPITIVSPDGNRIEPGPRALSAHSSRSDSVVRPTNNQAPTTGNAGNN